MSIKFHENLEEVGQTFPELVEEFDRLRLWVLTLAGEHVAAVGGPKVDAPPSEHAQAAAELAHQRGDLAAAEVQRQYAADLRKAEAGQ